MFRTRSTGMRDSFCGPASNMLSGTARSNVRGKRAIRGNKPYPLELVHTEKTGPVHYCPRMWNVQRLLSAHLRHHRRHSQHVLAVEILLFLPVFAARHVRAVGNQRNSQDQEYQRPPFARMESLLHDQHRKDCRCQNLHLHHEVGGKHDRYEEGRRSGRGVGDKKSSRSSFLQKQ